MSQSFSSNSGANIQSFLTQYSIVWVAVDMNEISILTTAFIMIITHRHLGNIYIYIYQRMRLHF